MTVIRGDNAMNLRGSCRVGEPPGAKPTIQEPATVGGRSSKVGFVARRAPHPPYKRCWIDRDIFIDI